MVKCPFGLPRTAWIRSPLPPLSASDARHVGNNPDAVSPVGRAGVPSTHHERPDGVSFRFQRSVYPVVAASSEARHVFKTNPTGSHFAHDPHGFPEQSRSCPVDPFAVRVRGAGVLAGRTPGHNVNWSDSIGPKSFGGDAAHVVVYPDAGKVSGELGSPPSVDLASGDGSESGPLKTETPSAAPAAEKIEDIHLGPRCLRREKANRDVRRLGRRTIPKPMVLGRQRILERNNFGVFDGQDFPAMAGAPYLVGLKRPAMLGTAIDVAGRAAETTIANPIRLAMPYRIRGDGTEGADTDG
jgi:hypothetical protein